MSIRMNIDVTMVFVFRKKFFDNETPECLDQSDVRIEEGSLRPYYHYI